MLLNLAGENYYYDVSKKAITYTLKISESGSFDKNDIQITNVVYEPISTSSLGDLDPKNIPETPNAYLKTTTARELRIHLSCTFANSERQLWIQTNQIIFV